MPKPKEERSEAREESVVEVVATSPVSAKGYRVFDGKANLVAQVASEDEAREVAVQHQGFYNALS